MKNYELLDAVGGIDAKYVENSTRKRKSGREPLWAKIVSVAACLCLIVGAAVLFRPGTSNPPVGDNTIVGDTTAPLPTDQTIDTSPVYYSSLMLADSVLNEEALAFSSSVMFSVKAFDESMLSQDHCCMIIEGTVVNLYVKHYTYDIYSDKFEGNGILHGRTDTIVYEVAVDKTWYGGDISGETIFVEDISYFTEPILAVKEGRRYVLPIYKSGDTISISGEFAGGDITRDSQYSTLYAHHPQIEVTNDGSYLVSQDWTTLVADNAKEVIMDTLDEEDYWKDKIYLVDENTFANQMAILIDSVLE